MDTGTHPLAAGEAGDKEKAGRMALLAMAQTQGMRAMGAQWLRGMVHPDVLGAPLFESIQDMLERSNPAQFAAQIKALLARPDAAPVLPHISCPTLLLTGEQDLWSPPQQHVAMAETIAGAQLRVIAYSGHMSTMEQPIAVAQAMREWLES
jgi:pimeloyl-ACP methyl ester carboxylesterase